MATNTLLETELDQLFLSDGTEGSGRFKFMCCVESFEAQVQRNFTERMVRDCDDPAAKPVRKSTPGGFTGSYTLTGHVAQSNAMYRALLAAAEAGTRVEMQHKKDLSGANGGGAYVFFAYAENFNESAPNEGAVTFTCTVRVDGARTWTAAS